MDRRQLLRAMVGGAAATVVPLPELAAAVEPVPVRQGVAIDLLATPDDARIEPQCLPSIFRVVYLTDLSGEFAAYIRRGESYYLLDGEAP